MAPSIKKLAVAAFFTLSTAPAMAADPSYLWVGAGTWETFRDQYRTGEFDLAYRPGYQFWIFKPHVGFLVAGDGDYYGYAGILTDIKWTNHLVTTLSTAVGGYGGHGYRLGSTVEFRSGIDFAWQFSDQSRLGVGIYHISNAGLTDRNPGSESALLSYSYPLKF